MSTPIEVMGHRIHVDPNNSLGLTEGNLFEPTEAQLIQLLIKRGDTVLDIGANVGYFRLLMARIVGDEGRVYSFEPSEQNAALLKRNIDENGYTNVTIVPKAVTNQSGSSSIYLSDENVGDHRVYPSEPGREAVSIETVSLDEFFGGKKVRVALIKMDIQGAEPMALEGMRKFLERQPDVNLIMEFWPYGIQQSGHNELAFLQMMSALGFICFEIEEGARTGLGDALNATLRAVSIRKRLRRPLFTWLSASYCGTWFVRPTGLRAVSINQLARRYRPGNKHHTNLLWTRDIHALRTT